MAAIDPELDDILDDFASGIGRGRTIQISFTVPDGVGADDLKIRGLTVHSITGYDGHGDVVEAVATPSAIRRLARSEKVEEIIVDEDDDETLEYSREAVETPNKLNGMTFEGPTGKATVICIIDSNFNAMHRSFRNADGTTRFLAIWNPTKTIRDRAGNPVLRPPAPYDAGYEFQSDLINFALSPPGAGRFPISRAQARSELAYLAWLKPGRSRNHGTHVAGIAAGNGRYMDGVTVKQSADIGIAPEALLVGIISRTVADTIKGIQYFAERIPALLGAGEKLAAVNVSRGNHAGPHTRAPARAKAMYATTVAGRFKSKNGQQTVDFPCVFAIGNSANKKTHAKGTLAPSENTIIKLKTQRAWARMSQNASRSSRNRRNIKVKLFAGYNGRAEYIIEVKQPGVRNFTTIPVGGQPFKKGGRNPFYAVARKVPGDNSLSELTLILRRPARRFRLDNEWQIRLTSAQLGNPADWNIWISSRMSRYIKVIAPAPVAETTHAAMSVAVPMTVANFEAGRPVKPPADFRLAASSSQGPAAKNAESLVLVAAPGTPIKAPVTVKRPVNGRPKLFDGFADKNGTSMASPHVAGAFALMKEVNPALDRQKVLDIIRDTTKTPTRPDPDTWGYGILDIKAAVEKAKP